MKKLSSMALTKNRGRRNGHPKRKSVIAGYRYIPIARLAEKVITLQQARRILSNIKGGLAQTVSDMRDEE